MIKYKWGKIIMLLGIVLLVCSSCARTEEAYSRLDPPASFRKQIIAVVDSSFSQEGVEEVGDSLWAKDENVKVADGCNFIEENDSDSSEENGLTHGDLVIKSFLDTIGTIDLNIPYELMLLKVLDEEGRCKTSDLISAIRYAEENGAKICNLSISTYHDDKNLREAIVESEMLFVAAAGNEGENLDGLFPSYPTKWNLDNVISVAATDDTGALMELSNYGVDTVDVAANGILEEECVLGEGTSFSTPKATAIVTAVWSSRPNLLPAEIKDVITSTAIPTKELKRHVKYGLLDSEHAVALIR